MSTPDRDTLKDAWGRRIKTHTPKDRSNLSSSPERWEDHWRRSKRTPIDDRSQPKEPKGS